MTPEEVIAAALRADAAGDSEGAALLVQQYRSMQAGAASQYGLGETALQGFAHGTTLGLKDETDGGGAVLDATYRPEAIANPWLMGQDMYSDNAPETVEQVKGVYEQARNDSRDRWTAMEKQNPKTALASMLAGGLATGFGAYGGGLTATKTGLKALPAITADGAAWGSAYGLGETEDMGNFTQIGEDVASGAALGAGLGFAGHYVGQGLGKAGNAIQDRWFRGLSPEQLKLKAASNIISKGINPNDVPNPGNLGDDTLVIDALGTYGERLARTVANRSPQAEYDLKSALYARKTGANDRLSNALLKAARLNPNTQPMVAELKKRAGGSKKSAVSKAYHEAEIAGEDIPLSAFDALKQGSPSIALAFKRAQRSGQDRALIEGRQSPTTLGVVQSAKEVLDDQAGKGFRTGANKNKPPTFTSGRALPEHGGDTARLRCGNGA